jgi:signal transduction histidine kinase/CheY-like chemotaxis protein
MAQTKQDRLAAERARDKAALLDAAMLHRMNDLAGQGILLTDTDLFVCAWNQWLADRSGITAQAAIGKRLLDLYPDLRTRGLQRQYQWALEGQVRVLSQRLHGHLLPMPPVTEGTGFEQMQQSARISPLLDQGRVVGTVTVIDDVTERVAREAELQSQIEFGTQLLAREHTAREEAEEANRLKDDFLATVSHELRTPLNAIMGWSQLLLSGKLDASTSARAVETIHRNAKAQNQLISDILDVSRIITGKLVLDPRPLDLSQIIANSLDALRPAANLKNITIESVIDSGAAAIIADANRLQQVIWNLLSNAVKFTPQGGSVSVTLSRTDQEIQMTVRDSGIGISPEFLPKVFDRFRQADGATTRSHGGLGLGLSIVRHLVELHGGSVRAESPGEGQGATFIVTLPLAAARSIVVRKTSDPTFDRLEDYICPPALKGLRVMVVDDEHDTCEMMRTLLEKCGCHVATATSAPEALALISRHLPDLLISDIGMPGEDGYSLIAKLRALPADEGGSIPAIALTAYAAITDKQQMLRSGFQIHVAKPFQVNEFLAAIADLVTRNGSGGLRQSTLPRTEIQPQ